MKIISAILVLLISTFTFLSCSEDETTTPQSNNPPTTPSNPSPINGATDVSRSPVLSWTCSDPDAGDSIKYDLFFSSVNPPNTQIASGWIYPNYTMTGLENNQTYYWRITAKDLKGASSVGPIWRFTTVVGLPTQGLVAYYPFNGNTNDESGNGHNGLGYNTTDSNDRFGNLNSSFHFNGTDSKVTVTNFPILTDNFSYSCWIKIVGNNWNNNIQSFGILGTGPSNHTWDLGYDNVDRRWDLWDATPDSWYTDYSLYATNNLLDWTYVTVVYNANSKSLYVNGILLNSKSVVLPLPFKGDNTLVIGNFQGTVPNEQAMNGSIDDIRIYNRALTNSEIQALYHEGGW